MPEFTIDAVVLTGFVSAALSLVFSYLSVARDWFEKKTEQQKKLWMLGFIVAAALGAFGLDCAGWIVTNLTCTPFDITQLLYAIVVGIATNQGAHKLLKPVAKG